jgi:hypothetical protein
VNLFCPDPPPPHYPYKHLHKLQGTAWGWVGKGALFFLPSPYPHLTYLPTLATNCTEYRILNTEYRIQKVMYMKLPMHLFFYMALGLNDFDAGQSITQAIERGGPLKTLPFWPKKVSIFRGHYFQWPSKWMLPASKSLRPAPYKQQVHCRLNHHFEQLAEDFAF